jgi:soluble lytic murein transglycosylase-like protein/tetratricopeptide (TPR) repeat protein
MMATHRLSIAFSVAAALLAPAAHADEAIPSAGIANPQVLSWSDVAHYRDIFAAERAGKLAKAEALYDKLADTSLKGYVLAERYLSPHGKRVPVATLVEWLRSYGELPIAERIHKLALKRATKKVRRHHHTVEVTTAFVPGLAAPAHRRGGGYEDVDLREPPLGSDAARTAQDQINTDIHADAPDQAMAVLQSLIASNVASSPDIARLSQHIAASYFAEGMDQQAYDLAARVAETDRKSVPMLDWNAGLAAFRLGKFDDAAKHFEILAQVGSVPNWTRSGAAFWAARSHMRGNDPGPVVTLLTFAARDEPTFYGLLAERMLGQDTQSGLSEPVLDSASFAQLMQIAPAHRAVALWQVGERGDVGPELDRAFGESDTKLDPAFAALARKLGSPNLELRASETSASRGIKLTGLFPVPEYKPDGGYTIDPSLVLAFVRIETRFQAGAVSPAGARGLMQLMPATAAQIGGRGAVAHLNDPTYNMTLGQRYIAQLLDKYNGNLVELAAAYNAGPGKVTQWIAAREGKEDDVLLFIESMRAPETRLYVKRVLMYHWLYRRRMGDEAKSLDETASGTWPLYRPPQQSAPPPPPADTDDSDDKPDAPATN